MKNYLALVAVMALVGSLGFLDQELVSTVSASGAAESSGDATEAHDEINTLFNGVLLALSAATLIFMTYLSFTDNG